MVDIPYKETDMGELTTISLIKAIEKRAIDKDGLTPLDLQRIKRDFSGRIKRIHLRRALDIFSDMKVTKVEREELRARLWITPRVLMRLNDVIGTGGRGLIKKRVELFAKRAARLIEMEISKKAGLLAETAIQKPLSFLKVPANLRRRVITAAISIALSRKKDISYLIALLPKEFIADRSLILPLVKKQPRYLALIAPQLTRFPTDLAIQAYRFGITHGARFPDAKALAAVVNNHLLAENDTHDPRPIAVMIYPRDDWNSVFQNSTSMFTLLNKGYRVRYYEAETEQEAVAALKDATKRRKASLVIFGGHGNQKSIALGAPDPQMSKSLHEKYYLDISDGADLKGLASRIVKGGHIVLDSCSNASGGPHAANMIQFMSRQFPHAYVHAMTHSASSTYLFNNKGLFAGIQLHQGFAMMGRLFGYRIAVARKDIGHYEVYDSIRTPKKFPHPPPDGKATTAQRIKSLKALARNQRDLMVMKAAANELGLSTWGKVKIDFKLVMMPSLITGISLESLKMFKETVPLKSIDVVVRMGKSAAPLLIAGLKHGGAGTQMASIYALTKIMGKRSVPWLIGLFDQVHQLVRSEIMNSVEEMGGPAAIAWFESLLKRPKREIRVRAAAALVNLKHPRYIKTIVAMGIRKGIDKIENEVKFTNPKAVPTLIGLLKHPKASVRKYAIEKLGKIKDSRVVPALIPMLNDPDPDVRTVAVYTLTDFKDNRSILALIPLLRDKRSWGKNIYKGAILDMLIKLKDKRGLPAVRWLAKNERSIYARMGIVRALAVLGGAKEIPLLAHVATKDQDAMTRLFAVNALAKHRGRTVVKALIKATRDKSPRVRIPAAKALIAMNKRSYVKTIRALAKNSAWHIRYEAVKALAEINDPGAQREYDALIKSASGMAWYGIARSMHDDPNIVKAIERALPKSGARMKKFIMRQLSQPFSLFSLRKKGRAKLKELARLLTTLLNDSDPGVRKNAVSALGVCGNASSVPSLASRLKDSSLGVRIKAAVALGKIKSPDAVTALIGALKNDVREVKIVAAWALGAIGDPRAIPHLIKTMNSWRRNPWISGVAIEALCKFKDAKATKALRLVGIGPIPPRESL